MPVPPPARLPRPPRLFVWALLGALLPTAASANGFDISPTNLTLAVRHRSALLTLANRGDQEVRFQISALSWDEGPEGQRLEAPTDDLIVFPSLVAIAPGTTRQIRVGTDVVAGAEELGWRLMVEQIPAPPEEGSVGLTFTTRMSIPVWLPPVTSHVAGDLGEVAQAGQVAAVEVHNAGNTHFRVQAIEAVGRDVAGAETGRAQVAGWYVLAGHDRTFRLPLEGAACANTQVVEVRVTSPLGAWTTRAPWDASRCGTSADDVGGR